MRLLFDVTRLLESQLHTGIQRVVRSLIEAAQQLFVGTGHVVIPVCFKDQTWFSLPFLAPHPLQGLENQSQPQGIEFEPRKGDHLLLFDASWYLQPWQAVDAALGKGVRLHAMVHDVLPIEQPQWFRQGLAERFSDHLSCVLERAETIFVPTVQVRERLSAILMDRNPKASLVTLPHGGDFRYGTKLTSPCSLLVDMHMSGAPVFLMVGTLEPRKNHELVLDAFDALWDTGHQARLLFVGNAGWRVERLLERIEKHPMLNDRLFHLAGIDDVLLHSLYGWAEGLIYMSQDEGFGLPILEAGMLGCPVIAADIPVLREAGGDWARYIPATKEALIAAIRNPAPRHPAAPGRTWADTARQLAATLSSPHE